MYTYIYIAHAASVACNYLLLLFDDNKIKLARKPGMIQKENPVGYTPGKIEYEKEM